MKKGTLAPIVTLLLLICVIPVYANELCFGYIPLEYYGTATLPDLSNGCTLTGAGGDNDYIYLGYQCANNVSFHPYSNHTVGWSGFVYKLQTSDLSTIWHSDPVRWYCPAEGNPYGCVYYMPTSIAGDSSKIFVSYNYLAEQDREIDEVDVATGNATWVGGDKPEGWAEYGLGGTPNIDSHYYKLTEPNYGNSINLSEWSTTDHSYIRHTQLSSPGQTCGVTIANGPLYESGDKISAKNDGNLYVARGTLEYPDVLRFGESNFTCTGTRQFNPIFIDAFNEWFGFGGYEDQTWVAFQAPGDYTHAYIYTFDGWEDIWCNISYSGYVYDAATNSTITGANVNFTQSGHWFNTTTNSSGWYELHVDENDTYGFEINERVDMTVSKSGYVTQTWNHTPTAEADYIVDWYLLPEGCTICGLVLDAQTHGPIRQAKVKLESSNSTIIQYKDTTNTGFFSFEDGIPDTTTFSLTATKIGYYDKTVPVTTNFSEGSQIVYIFLDRGVSEQATPSRVYTPHQVRFVCTDVFGKPIQGINVDATGISMTLGDENWLLSLFGLNYETTPIHNITMSGVTGSDGAITFLMIESVKYEMHFSHTEKGINETITLYPKEDEYSYNFFTLPADLTRDITGNINVTLYVQTINTTYSLLGVNYTDFANTTTGLTFYVKDGQGNATLYQTTTVPSGESTANLSTAVNSENAVSYIWGYSAQINTSSTNVSGANVITFKPGKLIDLGLSDFQYTWISVTIIFLFGTIFSAATVRFAAIIIPIICGFLYYIRWVAISELTLAVLFVLGIAIYIRKSEYKLTF